MSVASAARPMGERRELRSSSGKAGHARRYAGLLAAVVLLACAPEQEPITGIQTRVYVDRTETRVGSPIGVTVEIETPLGYSIETPAAPPPDERFLTEVVERLDPILLPGGVRHRLLWTLRARGTGDLQLPQLLVPLARPDGRIDPMPVGGVPIPVRSVRAEMPDREIYFDIQPAPATEGGSPWWWIGAGSAGALLTLIAGAALQRRRREAALHPSESALSADARAALAAALAEGDARVLARRVGDAIRAYVERRWKLDTASITPDELPEPIDGPLVDLLDRLDGVRFARHADREGVIAIAGDARAFFEARGPDGAGER
jgi:hypothetical protein